MADIKNVYQVAEEMGNSPAMVKKHYFQAVTKAEVTRFWTPAEKRKETPFT